MRRGKRQGGTIQSFARGSASGSSEPDRETTTTSVLSLLYCSYSSTSISLSVSCDVVMCMLAKSSSILLFATVSRSSASRLRDPKVVLKREATRPYVVHGGKSLRALRPENCRFTEWWERSGKEHKEKTAEERSGRDRCSTELDEAMFLKKFTADSLQIPARGGSKLVAEFTNPIIELQQPQHHIILRCTPASVGIQLHL